MVHYFFSSLEAIYCGNEEIASKQHFTMSLNCFSFAQVDCVSLGNAEIYCWQSVRGAYWKSIDFSALFSSFILQFEFNLWFDFIQLRKLAISSNNTTQQFHWTREKFFFSIQAEWIKLCYCCHYKVFSFLCTHKTTRSMTLFVHRAVVHFYCATRIANTKRSAVYSDDCQSLECWMLTILEIIREFLIWWVNLLRLFE